MRDESSPALETDPEQAARDFRKGGLSFRSGTIERRVRSMVSDHSPTRPRGFTDWQLRPLIENGEDRESQAPGSSGAVSQERLVQRPERSDERRGLCGPKPRFQLVAKVAATGHRFYESRGCNGSA